MKERPIIFKGDMVRTILDGRKTQTRPIVGGDVMQSYLIGLKEFDPDESPINEALIKRSGIPFRHGIVGDRLWVRETWGLRTGSDYEHSPRVFYKDGENKLIHWMADNNIGKKYGLSLSENDRWRPSIHMPRWASRINLEITNVRIERVKYISLDDCIAEGAGYTGNGVGYYDPQEPSVEPDTLFAELWNSIYKDPWTEWDANPWVWAIQFKKLEEE